MAVKTVHIPWYATLFRADRFEEALEEIAPLSLRYGATRYFVFRGGDDRYRFSLYMDFETKLDFERFWMGPEFNAWRTKYTSWFQIPVVYDWGHTVDEGRTELVEAATAEAPAEA